MVSPAGVKISSTGLSKPPPASHSSPVPSGRTRQMRDARPLYSRPSLVLNVEAVAAIREVEIAVRPEERPVQTGGIGRHRPAGNHDFALVGDAVAIGVVEAQQIGRRGDVEAAAIPDGAGRERQVVGEDRGCGRKRRRRCDLRACGCCSRDAAAICWSLSVLPEDSQRNRRPRSSNVPIIGYELSSGPAANSTLNPAGTRIAGRPVAPDGVCAPKSMSAAAALNRMVPASGAQNLRKVNRVTSKRFPCSSEMLSRLGRTAQTGASEKPARCYRSAGQPGDADKSRCPIPELAGEADVSG